MHMIYDPTHLREVLDNYDGKSICLFGNIYLHHYSDGIEVDQIFGNDGEKGNDAIHFNVFFGRRNKVSQFRYYAEHFDSSEAIVDAIMQTLEADLVSIDDYRRKENKVDLLEAEISIMREDRIKQLQKDIERERHDRMTILRMFVEGKKPVPQRSKLPSESF